MPADGEPVVPADGEPVVPADGEPDVPADGDTTEATEDAVAIEESKDANQVMTDALPIVPPVESPTEPVIISPDPETFLPGDNTQN